MSYVGSVGLRKWQSGATVLLSIAVTGAACGARTELGAPCPSAPIDPVAFPPVTFAGQATLLGWALDVTDDAAYFAASGSLTDYPSYYSRTLARAPLGGGEPEPFATDATYAEGMLAHDASYLYFPNAAVLGPSGVYVQNVVAAPLHGGPSRTLDNPPAPSQQRWLGSIGTNGDAGVFWIVTGPGFSDGLLAHWDGTTTTTLASFPSGPSTTPELTLDMAVSATQAFVLTSHALYSVPLSGGTPLELRAWPPVSPMSYAQPQIVALNDQSVFYSLDAATIVRRDIGSGDEHTIVGGLTLESLLYGSGRIGWADSSWLYFVTGRPLGDLWTLSRVRVDGGEVEVLWDSTARPPSLAVVGDACSIYWLTASAPTPYGNDMMNGPSILMYRRK